MCSVSALIMAKRKYKTLSSVVSVLLAYNIIEEKDRFVLEWRLGKHANYKIPWRQNTFLIFYVNFKLFLFISLAFNKVSSAKNDIPIIILEKVENK